MMLAPTNEIAIGRKISDFASDWLLHPVDQRARSVSPSASRDERRDDDPQQRVEQDALGRRIGEREPVVLEADVLGACLDAGRAVQAQIDRSGSTG